MLLEAWKPVGGARGTGRIKIAESSMYFFHFFVNMSCWASVMCQEETRESLEGVFPGGVTVVKTF